jgi:uncharacterized membrane protein YdbT with pleckstrin-like domain
LSYAEKHLLAGETVVYKTRLHWIVLIGHALLAAVFAIAGIWLLIWVSSQPDSGNKSNELIGAAALVVIGAIIFGVGIIRRNATVMVVTNKRVLITMGLASRRTLEMLFSKIETIVVDEPAFGRFLGYGTVILRGVGGTPDPFPRIAHPLEFRRQVQQQIDDSQAQPVSK